MGAPANNLGGGSGALPEFIDWVPIHRKNLLAQGRLVLKSGLIIRVNIIQGNDGQPAVFPVAIPSQSGRFTQIVEFASAELKYRFQAEARAAIEPFLPQILNSKEQSYNGEF